jgi:hypothetical protein
MKTINSPKTYKYYLYLCLCGVRMICKTKDVPPKDFFCNNCSKNSRFDKRSVRKRKSYCIKILEIEKGWH